MSCNIFIVELPANGWWKITREHYGNYFPKKLEDSDIIATFAVCNLQTNSIGINHIPLWNHQTALSSYPHTTRKRT